MFSYRKALQVLVSRISKEGFDRDPPLVHRSSLEQIKCWIVGITYSALELQWFFFIIASIVVTVFCPWHAFCFRYYWKTRGRSPCFDFWDLAPRIWCASYWWPRLPRQPAVLSIHLLQEIAYWSPMKLTVLLVVHSDEEATNAHVDSDTISCHLLFSPFVLLKAPLVGPSEQSLSNFPLFPTFLFRPGGILGSFPSRVFQDGLSLYDHCPVCACLFFLARSYWIN